MVFVVLFSSHNLIHQFDSSHLADVSHLFRSEYSGFMSNLSYVPYLFNPSPATPLFISVSNIPAIPIIRVLPNFFFPLCVRGLLRALLSCYTFLLHIVSTFFFTINSFGFFFPPLINFQKVGKLPTHQVNNFLATLTTFISYFCFLFRILQEFQVTFAFLFVSFLATQRQLIIFLYSTLGILILVSVTACDISHLYFYCSLLYNFLTTVLFSFVFFSFLLNFKQKKKDKDIEHLISCESSHQSNSIIHLSQQLSLFY